MFIVPGYHWIALNSFYLLNLKFLRFLLIRCYFISFFFVAGRKFRNYLLYLFQIYMSGYKNGLENYFA